MKVKLGLIVNPVAGLGGAVALKGTDGEVILEEALRRGAKPLSETRAITALKELRPLADQVELVTAGGAMGEVAAKQAGLSPNVMTSTSAHTTAADTKIAAQDMRDREVDLIVFAGGDGTARDIQSVIATAIPVLGIPAGVKMQSGVFATSPAAAGRLLKLFVEEQSGAGIRFREAEVMDIDEDAVRAGIISPRLHGYARVPDERRFLQQAKAGVIADDETAIAAAAQAMVREMEPDIAYIIGPGRSAKRVLEALGLQGTLLGIDLVKDRKLIGTDLTGATLQDLCASGEVRIIAGVTGGQGFVFGRGNQQIGAELVARAGRQGLLVIAGRQKLASLPDARLLADTGDAALDESLAGHIRVRCGKDEWAVMRLVPA
jgi:predicted polyphosphate/ATP-dependent NAD kinase